MQLDDECEKCIQCWHECDSTSLLCEDCLFSLDETDSWMLMSVMSAGVNSARSGDLEIMLDMAREINKEEALRLHDSGHEYIYARNDVRWDWHKISDPIIRHTESTVYYEYMTDEVREQYLKSCLINLDDFDFEKCYDDILDKPYYSMLASVRNCFDRGIGYKNCNTWQTRSIRNIIVEMISKEERPEYIKKINALPYKIEDESDY